MAYGARCVVVHFTCLPLHHHMQDFLAADVVYPEIAVSNTSRKPRLLRGCWCNNLHVVTDLERRNSIDYSDLSAADFPGSSRHMRN
jgi:hypothetical protein